MSALEPTIGFVQEIPDGIIFEIGNSYINRSIHCTSGIVTTTSLTSAINGEEYLEETNNEFELKLSGENATLELTSKDFKYVGYETPNWTGDIRTLEIKLETQIEGTTFPVSIFYEVKSNQYFIRKWITAGPADLDGWVVRNVTIENMRLKEMVEGVVPQPRYSHQYPNYEDNVHIEPDKPNTLDPDRKFLYGDLARSVVSFWGYGEGLYFFTESLLGDEKFYRPQGLVMKQRDYIPLAEKFSSGPAVIGVYSGTPELGFKRYSEHLYEHYCAVKGKSVPVSWSTWLVTLENNSPLRECYDRNFLLEYIGYIKEAGFYETLQLDLGWEAEYPLKSDFSKFPYGISEIIKKASEDAGLDMAYWMNPFSCNYWKSKVEEDYPEWLSPDVVSGRSHATAICPLSEYWESVDERMVQMVTEMKARLLYWDGNDWNIRDCKAKKHGHIDFEEIEVNATKKLALICEHVHEARKDAIIAAFSLPLNNHRLSALDQEQISDTYSFPIVQSELIQRQQIYQMAWEHPYQAIRGSWYGVGWIDSGDSDLSKRPYVELVHAFMSMIGNGLVQSGGSIDFKQAPERLIRFLKKLFAFRKRFEKYFNTYQHILGFPDGKNIDGEGHIVDCSGFIVLINPTDETLVINVPLKETELELDHTAKYALTDWSNFEKGIIIGVTDVENAPELELAPLEVKYVGVNITI